MFCYANHENSESKYHCLSIHTYVLLRVYDIFRCYENYNYVTCSYGQNSIQIDLFRNWLLMEKPSLARGTKKD